MLACKAIAVISALQTHRAQKMQMGNLYDKKRKANIVLGIKEGRRTILSLINFFGIPHDIASELRKKMINKVVVETSDKVSNLHFQ